MLCKACLDIFRRPNRKLGGSKSSFPHQRTAEAVCKSCRQGCDICARLWKQIMDHPDRPFGDERWYRLSTAYTLDRVRDKVKTTPGRSSTSPYRQDAYWSGLAYKLSFCWSDEDRAWSDPPPSLDYHLLAAESENSVPVKVLRRLILR